MQAGGISSLHPSRLQSSLKGYLSSPSPGSSIWPGSGHNIFRTAPLSDHKIPVIAAFIWTEERPVSEGPAWPVSAPSVWRGDGGDDGVWCDYH